MDIIWLFSGVNYIIDYKDNENVLFDLENDFNKFCKFVPDI